MQDPKTRHLGTIPQLCPTISSQLRHVSTIRKKNLLSSNLPHMSLQYGELRPTSDGNRFVSLRHASKFQRFSRLAFITAATSLTGDQPHFARCLTVSCAATLYIYFFFGALAPWQNFAGCKIHFTYKSCVLLYWQHYCTALQQRASAKLCGVVQEIELLWPPCDHYIFALWFLSFFLFFLV